MKWNSVKVAFYLAVLGFMSTTFVFAASFSEINSQIQKIKQILNSIQQTLGVQNTYNINSLSTHQTQPYTSNTATTSTTTTPNISTNTISTLDSISCPSLTKSLYLGVTSTEVKQLQQFLDKLNLFNYPIYTNYFGPVTQKAVQAFQCKYLNLCQGSPFTNGYGVVGPRTRNEIFKLCTQNTNSTESVLKKKDDTTQTQTTTTENTTENTEDTNTLFSFYSWAERSGVSYIDIVKPKNQEGHEKQELSKDKNDNNSSKPRKYGRKRNPNKLNKAKADFIGVHYDYAWGAVGNSTEEKDSDRRYLIKQVQTIGAKTYRLPIRWLALYERSGVSCSELTLKPWVMNDYVKIVQMIPEDARIIAYLDSPPATCREEFKTNPDVFTQKYVEYVGEVVSQFKDRIKHWEIWNEPNQTNFALRKSNGEMWTGGEYVRYLLKPAYEKIKSIDKDAKVLVGSMTWNGVIGTQSGSQSGWYMRPNFIKEVYQAGGKNYFDIMNIHPYMQVPGTPQTYGYENLNYIFVQDTGKYLLTPREQIYGQGQLADIMKEFGDENKPIWWTEFNLLLSSVGNDETVRTNYVMEAIKEAWQDKNKTPHTELVTIYTLRDSYNPESNYGLLKQDNTRRPLFDLISVWIRD